MITQLIAEALELRGFDRRNASLNDSSRPFWNLSSGVPDRWPRNRMTSMSG